jgi:hypothetical protein
MPFAPDQRLPDYFALIGADEMPQKNCGNSLASRIPITRPGVGLNILSSNFRNRFEVDTKVVCLCALAFLAVSAEARLFRFPADTFRFRTTPI